jgi:hypothetical protein
MGGVIGFLLILLDDVFFGSSIATPIDMSKIIARNIFTMLGKLNRETSGGAFLVANSQAFYERKSAKAKVLGLL